MRCSCTPPNIRVTLNAIHSVILKILKDLNIIDKSTYNRLWHLVIPEHFLTVQRDSDSDNIKIGESNEAFENDIEEYNNYLSGVRNRYKNGKIKFINNIILW